MTFERSRLKEVQKVKRPDPTPIIARAAIKAELVTRSEEWNFYLEIMQARLEETRKALDQIREAFFTDTSFDHSRLVVLKAQGMLAEERIRTLEEIMSIPQDIMKSDHD